MKKTKIWTIPNILSFFRILLIPFIMKTYDTGAYWKAAALVALSGLTDLADGYIARRFQMVSALGKALDPIADKLTMLALLLCLCAKVPSMTWLLGVVAVKEVLMGLEGLLVLRKTGTTYSALWYGKLNTALLYGTILLHLLWSKIPLLLSNLLVLTCTVWNLVSLLLYTRHNRSILRAQ